MQLQLCYKLSISRCSFQFETEAEGGKLRRNVLVEGNVGSVGAPTAIVSMLSGQEEMFAFRRAVSFLCLLGFYNGFCMICKKCLYLCHYTKNTSTKQVYSMEPTGYVRVWFFLLVLNLCVGQIFKYVTNFLCSIFGCFCYWNYILIIFLWWFLRLILSILVVIFRVDIMSNCIHF